LIEFETHPSSEKIFQFEKDLFEHHWTLSQIEEHLKFNEAWILIFQNREIAYILFQRNSTEIEIYKIAVLPEFQKKGFASKILERLSMEYGKHDFFLEVNVKNRNAISFYLKNNFKKISIRKKYYSDNEDALIMKKERTYG
jgi:[ribosomal protein S18]-alanine N-acetyltransferase